MRALVLTFSLSTVALAQSEAGGVWTGYVGGWKPGAQVVPSRVALPPWTLQVPQWTWWQLAAVQSAWAAQAESQRQARELEALAAMQAAEERLRQAEQARREQLAAERLLAAEREAILQRHLEQERRLAAERELLALQQREAERAAAAAKTAPPVSAPSRPDAPAARTPGNDVYRWTDEEGVVHYSTRVPAEARAIARKVGAAR